MISFITRDDQHSRLWKELEKEKVISHEDYKSAVKRAKRTDRHIAEVLFEVDRASQDKLLKIFSTFYNLPAVDLHNKVIARYVLTLIPKEVAEQHSIVVFKKKDQVIHIATTNPDNEQAIDFIRKKTGLEPLVHLASQSAIQSAIRKYQSEIKSEFAKIVEDSIQEALNSDESPEKIAQFVPVIKMLDTVIDQALTQNASDIHIEPGADAVVIRYRVDGLLKKIVELPREILPPLLTRIKLLSSVKIDENRLPQDGRFTVVHENREVAIRTSIIPTLHGSKVVMRLLDRKRQEFTLQKLGLNKRDYMTVRDEITKPHGMVLVTGPTGSGKTTTLYAILQLTNKEGVNISTIEDPIEYGLPGINQTQVNPAAGLTFANGLRSLLRQDPNILMVGEIRDTDTAAIAVNAAMTGHLVLTTLHTNSAFQVLERLVEMGVLPFLAASVTRLVIGQRLLRQICSRCRTRVEPKKKLLERYQPLFKINEAFNKLTNLGLLNPEKPLSHLPFYYGKGCAHCNQTGYRGRLGVFEILKVDDRLHQAIIRDPSADSIKKAALDAGATTMVEDGLLKVFQGQTTFEELVRVTRE
ncbi:MAG: type II/IV secretion system protein [Candidatus Kerfeldbacteria bacterium]|nr:type II/IV secretion system protein [Candidatus Kerfeldbacteria bacterium]